MLVGTAMKLSNLLTAYEADMGTVCDGRDLKANGAHYRCTRQATEILVVHQMDECENGDRVMLLCVSCKSAVCKEKDDMLRRMKSALPPPASWLECTTCGKRIKKLGDICSVEPLLNV